MRPKREHATNTGQTYMVTTETWERRALFHVDSWAKFLIDTLYHYRREAYLLHEFVIMPDHIHLLITPQTSLEKAVQFIKGGFSYRGKKELGSNMEVWQRGFQDHRIRDANDYAAHVSYIHNNPVKERLCEQAQDFLYSSAHPGFELDPIPQGLKPLSSGGGDGAPEGAPFQNTAPEAAPLQSNRAAARLKSVRFQESVNQTNESHATTSNEPAEAAPLRVKSKTA